MREHVACSACGQDLEFGVDVLYGRTTQRCGCGDRLLVAQSSEVRPDRYGVGIPKVNHQLTCVVCGKPFEAKRKTKQCCSDACVAKRTSTAMADHNRREREAGRPKQIAMALNRRQA